MEHFDPPTRRLQTKLYKVAWNASTNNSETMYRTDPRIGEGDLKISTFLVLGLFHETGMNLLFGCVTVKMIYCRFSLSHHHQNHSINKVKNQRDKRRCKQSRKGSDLCDVSCRRYSKKCFTQIYKALYGDTMFVSLSGTQIWRPEAHKNIWHRVLL